MTDDTFMSNFVSFGNNGDHIVPEDEQNEHCPFDFCECHPQLRPFMGRWLWVHQSSDEKQLFEQAEAIRQCVSIELWRAVEGKKIKFEVLPFPQGFQGSVWPKPAEGHPIPIK